MQIERGGTARLPRAGAPFVAETDSAAAGFFTKATVTARAEHAIDHQVNMCDLATTNRELSTLTVSRDTL